MGLCERIVNVVISSCKIMFLLTDFQVLHFCWSLVSAKNTFEIYLWSSWRLKKECWCSWSRRDSRRLNWVGRAAFLLFQVSSELVVFIDVYWDGRRFVRSVYPLEIKLTSSLIRWEDWLSWPSSSKRSTCNCSYLRRLISLICLLRIDVAVFWWGCCFITFCDISLSSFSFDLVRWISRDKDRKLFLCWMVFSKRSSWFFLAISVALNILMANWHSAVICLDILLLVVFCWPFVAVVDVTLQLFIEG